MAFRQNPNISNNQTSGLHISNAITNGDLVVTGRSLTGSQPMDVAIVDASGNQIATFGGGTQYAENTTTAPGTGTLALGRFTTVAPSLTDGQMHSLQLDTSGNLLVSGSLSVGGTTDNSAFTAGAGTGTPSMGFYHSVIDTVTDGRSAVHAITNKRAIHTNLRDSSGNETGVAGLPLQVSLANTATNATAVKVDGSAVTQPVSLTSTTVTGTVTVAGGKTNNNAAPLATNVGVLPAIPNAAAQSWTEGNQVALSTDLSGQLRVTGSLSVGGTTDNSAFTAGSSTGTPTMGFYHSTIDTVTDGRSAAVAITPKRAMMVNLQTAAGVEITNTSNALDINIKSGNPTTIAVTNTGTFAVQDTVLDAAIIAQEATTSGIKGLTAFGAVTTAAPTYVTAKSDALSLTTGGGLRTDISTIAGTAPTTAGFIDIKGADGNVFVRQATGSNLHTVVDSGTITAVTAITNALPAGTNVIGHVITDTGSTTAVTGTVTISGAVTEATLDAALIAQEATTSGIKGLTAFGAVTTAKPTYVTGKSDALSMDVNGLLRVSLADTPVNGNKLLVTADAITFASPQHVITDATSVTAATLSAETTKVIGTVNIASSQTIAVTNAGTFATQATLTAETTKVIGTVRTADGAGNLLTSTGNALDVNIKTSSITLSDNIAQIGGSSVATAATGIMKVGLTDGTGTAITSTASALDINIKSSITQNTQGTLTTNNAVPSTNNLGVLPAMANSSPQSYINGNQVLLSTDLAGNLKTTLTNTPSVDLATVAGQPVATAVPGVAVHALAGESGDIVSTFDNRLMVHARGTQDATEYTIPAVAYFNNSLSNTIQLVKSGRTNLYYINIYNSNSVFIFIQVFDLPFGTAILGSSLPTETWPIPPGGVYEEHFSVPLAYMNNLQIAATTTATGASAPTTGLSVNLRTTA